MVRFAQAVGTSHPVVVRWCQGRHVPRPDMMRRIVAVTGGAVTPADFYADPQAEQVAA